MFVASPNHPLEFTIMRSASVSTSTATSKDRRSRGAARRPVQRPNVVRLIPGLTRLPLGSDSQTA
jgi:hypothetical protein